MNGQTLQVLRGDNQGAQFELVDEEILLGRDGQCHVVIDSGLASRRHARLVRLDEGYGVEDLGSTNHTFVNGRQLSGRVRLNDKDQIGVGDTLLEFRSDLPAAVAKTDDASMVILNTFDARQSAGTAASINAEGKLRAILQITEALGSTLDLQDVLAKMLDGLFEIFPQADRALVLLLQDGQLVPEAVKHRSGGQDTVEYSKTIAERAIADRQAILSTDAAADERFGVAQSIVQFQIRSIMCVPLLSREADVLGVLQLDARQEEAKFDEDDVHILASVAIQASVSIESAQLHREMLKQARLQKEMDFAHEVQHKFLPKSPPELAGYAFWGYYLAAGKIGGDYYDFVRLPNGKQAALLGDVSGKGVPAALMMAKLSAVCKVALLSHPDDLVEAMAVVNREICEASVDSAFVTLALCIIDPTTHRISVANAGHMSPLFLRRNGAIDKPAGADVTGFPFGIVEDCPYPNATTTLDPGEMVVLYSDGISEAMNAAEELYSDERICEQLEGLQGKPPEQIGRRLLEDVRRHAAGHPQSDDISLVVFGRTAE